MFHFQLKPINKIEPAGKEPNQSLSWFYLSDGDLWLNVGNQTLYEYTTEALANFPDKPTPFNDYYIIRFIEDFSCLFEKISQSIPSKFYTITDDLEPFLNTAQKWLDQQDESDDEFYFEVYDKLISWIYERKLSSGHLIGGPRISFFRNENKLKIIWESDYCLDNGVKLWTATNDSYEMDYYDFVNEVEQFGTQFFKTMGYQIQEVIENDWPNTIEVDKKRLLEEHKERELEFLQNLEFLKNSPQDSADRELVDNLYHKMLKEIK